MLFLGCDPDMHSTAFAAVDETMKILAVEVCNVPAKLKGTDAVLAMIDSFPWAMDNLKVWANPSSCAVESQELYKGMTKNPRDIMHLAQVAGAACLKFTQCMIPDTVLYFPAPVQWKGSRDKLSHHKHILARAKVPVQFIGEMGGKEPYCFIYPDYANANISGASDLTPSDWKHVIDAIGLAQYAAERYTFETSKAKALAIARSK